MSTMVYSLWMSVLLFCITEGADRMYDLSETDGEFTTPNYPSSYNQDETITWSITVPEGSNIRLEFLDFELETSSNCTLDSVSLSTPEEGLLGEFCGTSLPPAQVSSGNTMTVVFYADGGSDVYRGFRARYCVSAGPHWPCVPTECSSESMTVRVVKTTAQVQVYPQGFQSDPDCAFTLDPDTDHFSREFLFNSSDCGASRRYDADTDKWFFSVPVYIQQAPDILQSRDIRYVSACSFNTSFSLSMGLANVNGSQGFQENSETVSVGASQLLLFTIQDDDAAILTANDYVILGANLTLNIELLPNTVFTALFVRDCRISNSADPESDEYTWLSLVDADGCVPSGTKDNLLVGEAAYSLSTYELTLPAFMFSAGQSQTDNTNTMVFTCDVDLCRKDNEDPCDKGCQDVVRLRRAAGEGSEGISDSDTEIVPGRPAARRRREARDEFTVQGVVRVKFPGDVIPDSATPRNETEGEDSSVPMRADPEQCLKHPTLQIFIAVMGVVLVALLLAVITLVILLCRRRQHKQAEDNLPATSPAHTNLAFSGEVRH